MAGNIGMSGFSGIDTQAMIQALMGVERQKLTRVEQAKAKLTQAETAWGSITPKLSALSTATADLTTKSRLITNTVTSSAPDKVRVSGSATPGALTFGVTQLATTAMHTVSGFSSSTAEVGAGTVTLSKGLSSIGFSAVTSGSGSATFSVTQASAKASVSSQTVSAVTVPPGSIVQVDITTPSGTQSNSVALTAGTYASATELAAMLTSVFSGVSGIAVSEQSGAVTLTNTLGEGSAYALTVSGDGATALGFAAGPVSGVDGVIDVDGVSTTLTNISAGGTVSAATATGTMTFTVGSSGHLALGSGSSTSESFAAGATLDQVSARLNTSGSTVTAAVIGSAGSSQLVITSRESGAAANTTVSWSGFSTGTVQQVRTGQDAVMQLGSQTLTRASNTVTDLLPGATVTLLGTTTDEVTITSALDKDALTTKVKGFVTALNDALNVIAQQTKVDPLDPTKNGPLASDPTARSLRRSIVSAVTAQLESGTYRSLAEIGVSVSRNGSFSVNERSLSEAIDKDVDAVVSVLSRGVSSADSRIAFASSTAATVSGSYAVSVSTAAERASVTGSPIVALSAPEIITVTSGTLSTTFTATAGMQASDVASGLSAALAKAGVPVFADVTAGAVRLTTTAYGSAASISVSSTGTALGLASMSDTGVDVAGTIAGVTGSGTGRTLSVSSGPAAGLGLSIGATPAEVLAAGGALSLGSAVFRTGIASLLRSSLDAATGAGGALATAKESRTAQMRRVNNDLTRMERSLDDTESRLVRQYAQLEQTISKLRSSVPAWPA